MTKRHSPRTTSAATFVVQKHSAHRAGLHWDFRLEHDGVLWSWAVPKGPSLDPADRRLAIHVEDHPLDYAGFQGTIPPDQYGAGTVEIWDHGTWEPLGDPEDGMREGELRFNLTGERLNGRFTLVRLHRRPNSRSSGQDAWFLIKGHDDTAREGVSAAVMEQELRAPRRGRQTTAAAGKPPAPGAKRGRPPADQAPQLCTDIRD